EHQKRKKDRDENPAFHLTRHWIVSSSAKRMAARKTARREPAASEHAMPLDSLCGVIGARRQETARAPEVGRNRQLVSTERQKSQAHAQSPSGRRVSLVVGGGAEGFGGNRLQGQSGRLRGIHVSGPRQGRTPERVCCAEKPLVSVA